MLKPKTKDELVGLIFVQKVNLSEIDTSLITDMSYLFSEVDFEDLEGSIENWDVSNVENMEYMLADTIHFNQDIGGWNVSKVKNMSHMFHLAKKFNQDIGAWNVLNVENMSHMFRGAERFDQDIGAWNVKNVQQMNICLQVPHPLIKIFQNGMSQM